MSLRWSGWGFAAWMFMAAVATATFFSFGLPHLIGVRGWITGGDAWNTTFVAQYLANGGASGMYGLSPWYSALPGFLFLYAPVVALGDHLGLVTAFPQMIPEPSMWVVSAPFFFLTGATAVLGVDYLADTLNMSRPRRRAVVAFTAVFVAAPTASLVGHPEDMVALGLACFSLALFLRDRRPAAAIVLGAAIFMQTWAVLLLPLVLAATPSRQRAGFLVRAAAGPAVITLLLLCLDFRDVFTVMANQPMPPAGQPLPWWHFARHITVTDYSGTYQLRAGATTRWLAVLASLCAAVPVWRRPSADRLLLAAAAVMFARGFFEGQIWDYYLAPAAVMAWLWGGAAAASAKRFAVILVAGFALYGCVPLSGYQIRYSEWLAAAILLASFGLCVAAGLPKPEGASVPEGGLVIAGT